jgi:hypothetical protein
MCKYILHFVLNVCILVVSFCFIQAAQDTLFNIKNISKEKDISE